MGEETLIGYILGINLVGIHLLFTSVIIGNQLRSVKQYSERKLKLYLKNLDSFFLFIYFYYFILKKKF